MTHRKPGQPTFAQRTTAGAIVKELEGGRRTVPELASAIGVSEAHVRTSLDYLLDRGAWLDSGTLFWSLGNRGVEWRNVTLGQLEEAGMAPEAEKFILRAAAQGQPAWSGKKEAVQTGVRPTVYVTAGRVARLLLEEPGGHDFLDIMRASDASHTGVERALRYLMVDRAVPLVRRTGPRASYSGSTRSYSLPPPEVDWRNVTLGEFYDNGALPESERWIWAAVVQNLPAPGVRRKVLVANATLARRLLR